MNRKGTIDMAMWIVRVIMTTVVFFTVFFLLQKFVKSDVDVSTAEITIFTNRLVFSSSLNYADSSGRLHPATIDAQKFNSPNAPENLGKEIDYGSPNNHIAAKIELRNLDADQGYNDVYYNKELYDRVYKLYRAGMKSGPGGVSGMRKSLAVLIKNGNEIQKGVMDVEIVSPNS